MVTVRKRNDIRTFFQHPGKFQTRLNRVGPGGTRELNFVIEVAGFEKN